MTVQVTMAGLSNDEMSQISGRLLGESGRAILIKDAMLAPHLPSLERVHETITAALAPDAHAHARAALKGSKQTNDATHDLKYEGIYHVLYGMSLLRRGTTLGEELEQALRAMFPDELAGKRASYPAQVSLVNRLKQTLAPAVGALLGKIMLPDGGTLDAERLAWFDAAEALERDLDEEAKLGAKPKTLTREENMSARVGWLRTVNALLVVIAVAEISDEERETLYRLAARVNA